jgi:hypothetical protein
MKPERPVNVSRLVTGQCHTCRRTLKVYVKHYEVFRCQCGAESWALQPKRDGSLVLFPHPNGHAKPMETF